jgi:hypothetical protein
LHVDLPGFQTIEQRVEIAPGNQTLIKLALEA